MEKKFDKKLKDTSLQFEQKFEQLKNHLLQGSSHFGQLEEIKEVTE
jgi:hypothetical protein